MELEKREVGVNYLPDPDKEKSGIYRVLAICLVLGVIIGVVVGLYFPKLLTSAKKFTVHTPEGTMQSDQIAPGVTLGGVVLPNCLGLDGNKFVCGSMLIEQH